MYTRSQNKSLFRQSFKNFDKAILTISKLLLGLVFVFSGAVKLIDPLGFTYKIDDYLTNFGYFFLQLKPLSLYAAIGISLLELVIGLCFLFHVKLKATSVIALILMAIMTPLTLYIALFNPVSDCGCFGEALKISNWQTFYKNLIISILIIVVLVLPLSKMKFFAPNIEKLFLILFISIGLFLSTYCYNHLPIIDFLPYKKGVNIPEAMKVPEDKPKDVYESTFIYEKNGKQKEFTLENYPKGDSTWVFVDQKTTLVSEGFKAPIHDFSIVSLQYEDITNEVIYFKGYTYLLVMYDLNKTSAEGAKKAEKIYQKYKNTSVKFYALTASSDDEIVKFKESNGVSFTFCKSDPVTLKTVIRSNPGLVLIKNSVIIGKWHWNDFE